MCIICTLLFLYGAGMEHLTKKAMEYGEANTDQKIGKDFVMENNENFVEQTENVVATTEEMPKTFTQADVDRMVKEKLDEVLPGKIARREAKIRKEYDRKYGDLEEVLKAGTGKESVEEVTDTFKQFYQKKGIQIPERPAFSASDIEVLARAEAEDIIRNGFDEVVEEVERLAALGAENMTPRDKAAFKILAEHRQNAERGRELAQIGVTEDVYNSQEFKDFAGKFTSNTPIRDIYDIYEKTQPKKNIKPMGSMKSNGTADNGIKDFYSFEEASKFTKADFDKNPALFDAVRKSMPKWK